MGVTSGRLVATLALVAFVSLAGCSTTGSAPGISFSNTDRSEEGRAEARCRADASMTGVGATAAYEACMASFRRPPDDE